jgi:hypothetical protein
MSHASSDRHATDDGAGSETAALSRSTLMTVRRVLHAYREGWLLEERLAAAARMAAEDARHRGVPAERMLVALKREWGALQEVRLMSARDAQDLLSRLVTLSIRAYYRPVWSARGARPAGPAGPTRARPVECPGERPAA